MTGASCAIITGNSIMIVSIGVDIVEIDRIAERVAAVESRFRKRIFTAGEIAYCESRAAKAASYAARFAAKEATMKALGTGWAAGVGWQDIEVVNDAAGAPSLKLIGRALERFQAIGARRAFLSLSHSKDAAIAQVIFED